MCLLFVYLATPNHRNGYKMILANNRDEFLVRPTDPAAFRQGFIAGIDQEKGREGGTWLGISKTGKMSCLLNILAPQRTDVKGRGFMVADFLTGNMSCDEYRQSIAEEHNNYNPFHLILLDLNSGSNHGLHTLCCIPDKEPLLQHHDNAFYSCDNGKDPARPWRKRAEGQRRFEHIVEQYNTQERHDELVDSLIQMLNDKTPCLPDEVLAEQFTEVGRSTSGEQISSRSAINVTSPTYGTRTNTLILVDQDGNCEYIERTLKTPTDMVDTEWTVQTHNFKF